MRVLYLRSIGPFMCVLGLWFELAVLVLASVVLIYGTCHRSWGLFGDS